METVSSVLNDLGEVGITFGGELRVVIFTSFFLSAVVILYNCKHCRDSVRELVFVICISVLLFDVVI